MQKTKQISLTIFFSDQFSDPSNYDISINFQDDHGINFSISHRDVRHLLLKLDPNKAQGPDGIHGTILKKMCYQHCISAFPHI